MPPSKQEDAATIDTFKSIGLPQSKAAEAAKNKKSADELLHLISAYELNADTGEKKAGLIAAFAAQIVKLDTINEPEKAFVVRKVLDGQLTSVDQINAAAKYVNGVSGPIDEKEFDAECGVGFSITPEELTAEISRFISSAAVAGWQSFGAIISSVRAIPQLRWANPLEIKNTTESIFTSTFGPKGAAPPKAKEPKKTPSGKAPAAASVAEASVSKKNVFEEGFLGSLHKPGENPQASPSFKENHLAVTHGQVWTRFPPEPNGFLHIGHSKAIFVNFGYAAHNGGKCYLRYDDTNPEAEEEKYFVYILEAIRWLGYQPWKITYSSDYFDQLYELAVELIKRGMAYVCHCTQQEIKADRGEKVAAPKPCKHRDRPVEESLAEFQKMKDGFYQPKEANLRMKQDLTDGNPQMWDLTAYRVLKADHHRTKDKWKIYPTYDFTHCLVDSIENISHSLCTTEFILSRQSYEWLCDAVSVYKPRQSEYGRLSIQGTVTSKRKLLALVNEGYVTGWDDPRLYTLMALRRRGVPPGAINAFVGELGVSTSASNIPVHRFDSSIRHYLENSAPRLLMVLNPIKVVIENLADDYVQFIEKPLHPKFPALGTSKVPLTRIIYIDADDFRTENSKEFYRLAPGKSVGLFGMTHPITCTSFKADPSTGAVTEIVATIDQSGKAKKPQAFIQWVAEHAPSGSPTIVDETRIYGKLFRSDNPLAVLPDYKADINPDSVQTIRGALIEVGLWSLIKKLYNDAVKEREGQVDLTDTERKALVGNEVVRFQGLRVGFFALDKDARISALAKSEDVEPKREQGDYLVLNLIVTLKEDSGKTV